MAKLRFFRKSHQRPRPPKPPKPPAPPQAVILDDGTMMSWRTYARLLGNAKGGQTAWARGKAHRWTSEEASKAAKKLWRTRWRALQHPGTQTGAKPIRIGLPAKRRAPVDHQALRDQYCMRPGVVADDQRVWFSHHAGCWYLGDPYGGVAEGSPIIPYRRITERTALRKLGHLPSLYRRPPAKIKVRIDIVDGTTVATKVNR